MVEVTETFKKIPELGSPESWSDQERTLVKDMSLLFFREVGIYFSFNSLEDAQREIVAGTMAIMNESETKLHKVITFRQALEMLEEQLPRLIEDYKESFDFGKRKSMSGIHTIGNLSQPKEGRGGDTLGMLDESDFEQYVKRGQEEQEKKQRQDNPHDSPKRVSFSTPMSRMARNIEVHDIGVYVRDTKVTPSLSNKIIEELYSTDMFN